MQTNEAIIRKLYAVAEGPDCSTAEFISLFSEDGYFYDVPAGQKYYGQDIGIPVDAYASAFPDMHREPFDIYVASDDVIVVELALQGTHLGDLHLPGGRLAPTGKRIDVPCCDVFHLKTGR